MSKPTTTMAACVAAFLAITATGAQAFHPFDQPAGYQTPKWLKDRTAPRGAANKPQGGLFGLGSGGQAGSIWGSDDDASAQAGSTPKAQKYPPQLDGGPRPAIAGAAPPVVKFHGHAPGTVVIDTAGKALYYVLSSSSAYRYPISVGRVGFTWTGTQKISRVASWPDWRPPQEMKERQPGLPDVMTGGIRNPLGAKALYLGNSLYRIHGTNDAKTIGQAASSGCFRMHNSHVVHLAGLASVGTTVKVLSKLPSNVASTALAAGKG